MYKPASWDRYSYVLNNPINASDPTGHICVGEREECLKDNKKPINGSDKRTVELSARAHELTLYGYSTDDLSAMIFQQESFPAWRDDPTWFSGEEEDPIGTYKEAAARWFWTWVNDPHVISIYGKVQTKADENAMMANWLVEAMQSEDGVNKEILKSYYPHLKTEFREMAREVLNPTNKEWTAGNGMWSWANAYLYEPAGVNYMNEHHLYKFGSGATAWFIIDADTVRQITPYKK